MGGEVDSVRRVSDYLSSHIDLDDYIHKDMGCTQRDDGPKEVKNHHAPLSQGARNQPVYSKVQFIQEKISDITSLKGYWERKGPRPIFRIIFSLAAR